MQLHYSGVMFAAKFWGKVVKISAGVPIDWASLEEKLMGGLIGKKGVRRARSRKHVIIPATLEWVFKQPGSHASTDPYQSSSILAAKVMSVRFEKLKKFKRDHGHLLTAPAAHIPEQIKALSQ